MPYFKHYPCEPQDLICIAEDIVTKATELAWLLIDVDKKRRFIYKLPKRKVHPEETINYSTVLQSFLFKYSTGGSENQNKVTIEDAAEGADAVSVKTEDTIEVEQNKADVEENETDVRNTNDSINNSIEVSEDKVSVINKILSDIMPHDQSLDKISGTIPDSTGDVHSFHAELPKIVEIPEKEVKAEVLSDKFSAITFCSSTEPYDIVDYSSDATLAHPERDSLKSNGANVDVESSSTTSTISEKYEPKDVNWVKIMDFDMKLAHENLRQYIGTWRLTEHTKWAIAEVKGVTETPLLGVNYFTDVYFSKPVNYCPNPLAIAKVHFTFHISYVLPKYYPVMVTYQFEGNKNTFYAFGDLCIRSADFQRHYIDEIIVQKTRCFAALVHVTNSLEQQKWPYLSKKKEQRKSAAKMQKHKNECPCTEQQRKLTFTSASEFNF